MNKTMRPEEEGWCYVRNKTKLLIEKIRVVRV